MKDDASKACSYCGEKKTHYVLSKDEAGVICVDCIERFHTIIHESLISPVEFNVETPLHTPRELKAKLDEYIVGQDDVKKSLSVAVYNHYRRIEANFDPKNDIEIDKSNVLLIGPTGSGKTLMASTLAKILNLPFAIADATTLTETGYVGDDVENILLKLIQNAQYDVKKAERGIVFIDEIDKISRKSESASITRDVSGEGVQQALLKILEGTDATVPPQGGRKHPQSNNIKINTKNILFICGGAFVGLSDVIKNRFNASSMGFNSSFQKKESPQEILKHCNTDDLVKYGLIPELIGRLPVVSVLSELSDEELKDVLLKPRNSILKQYIYLLELEGVSLNFTKEAIDEIIKLTRAMKTGARGLRAIIEKTMLDIMFNAPDSNIKSIAIGRKEIINVAKQIISVEENIA